MLYRNLLLLLTVSLLGTPARSSAQNVAAHPQISLQDSMKLNRYFDTIGRISPFSHKYQRYIDSVLMIAPWRAGMWQQKAMPLFKQHKCEAGMPFLDSAVKYDEHKYIDYRAFMKCIFQQSYREAIKDFEHAKRVVGKGAVMDHSYDFYIGLCYLQLDKLDSAQYFLLASIGDKRKELGDKWVHHLDLFYLGITYYEQEQYDLAMATLEYCLKQYPNFSDAKYYKGVCLHKTGRKMEGLALIAEAGKDLAKGYTINEDNAVHIPYPYQVNKHYFEN